MSPLSELKINDPGRGIMSPSPAPQARPRQPRPRSGIPQPRGPAGPDRPPPPTPAGAPGLVTPVLCLPAPVPPLFPALGVVSSYVCAMCVQAHATRTVPALAGRCPTPSRARPRCAAELLAWGLSPRTGSDQPKRQLAFVYSALLEGSGRLLGFSTPRGKSEALVLPGKVSLGVKGSQSSGRLWMNLY